MNVETNNMNVEKNFYFSCGISCSISWKKSKNIGLNLIKNFCDNNLLKPIKNTHSIYIDQEQQEIKTFDFYPLIQNHATYFYQCENCIDLSGIEHEKNLNNFIGTNNKNLFSEKKRIRRKFLTEDERRIARILKNRRTAEESRQRRIQKMKQLESFVITSEERERKLREEICFLAKQNASQVVELIIIKKKN